MTIARRAVPAGVRLGSMVLLFLLGAPTSGAAPFPPPGGPHRLHHGGDNTAPYPALTSVAVEDSVAHVLGARLAVLAYPNPARGETRFRAFLARGERTRARLYSVSGRLVREWSKTAERPGWLEWSWDGRDGRGRRVASGLYFLHLEAGRQVARTRVVLLEP